MTKPDCEIIFSFFDQDRNGTISYTEFCRAILGILPQERLDICEIAWQKLDPQNRGKIHVSIGVVLWYGVVILEKCENS